MHLLGLFGEVDALLVGPEVKVAESLVFADLKEERGFVLIAIKELGQADSG